MKSARILAALVVFVVVAACGRKAAVHERDVRGTSVPDRSARLVVERGCVTTSGHGYALTDLEAIGDAPPVTEAYQLMGNEQGLRQFAGKRVEVRGLADPQLVSIAREWSPTTKATGTSGTSYGAAPKPGEPKVATVEEARVQVRQLHVRSVQETGDVCGAATPATGAAPPAPRRR